MAKARTSKRIKKEWAVAYMFVLPALLFFSVFVLFPILRGVYISLFHYSGRTMTWVGFDNYVDLMKDDIYIRTLKNTFLLVLGTVPLVIIFSLFVSLNIYKKGEKLRSFFRAMFYLPAVMSIVTVTAVWGWIYHPSYGILNYITGIFGADPVSWLGDYNWALPSIIIVLTTLSVGEPIILYTASLGNIPKVYLEAAEIDGATNWQIFKHITWALLLPTSLYIIIITTIRTFQCFAIIQLLTAGGPVYRTSTVMYRLYEVAFTFGKYGVASAMGIILAIIVVLISIIQYKFLGSNVEY